MEEMGVESPKGRNADRAGLKNVVPKPSAEEGYR